MDANLTITYVMITNNKRNDVDKTIFNVRKELAPNDDLIVVGNVSGLPDYSQVTYLERTDWAMFGNTSHMRNAGYDNSRKNDLVIFLDDDIILPNNFRKSVVDYVTSQENFTSCVPKIISSKGFTLGKLAKCYNFDIYISMFVIVKREVFEEVRWDEAHGYYYGPSDREYPEDVKFSYDLVSKGYKLTYTPSFYVFLNDPCFYVYYGMIGQHHIDKVTLRPIKTGDKLVVTKDKLLYLNEYDQLMK